MKRNLRSFEQKALDFYEDAVIDKGLIHTVGLGARAIPVYVTEWIISQFLESNELNEDGKNEIINIISKYLPQKSDKEIIKKRLWNQESVQIIDDFNVSVNLEKNDLVLNIPIIDEKKARISNSIVEENPMLLKAGMWGLTTLKYIPPDNAENKKGQVWMVDFKPFQAHKIDVEYYKEGRKGFTLEEWVDFLISSAQFNPLILDFSQKMLLLARLVPLVVSRTNIVELAPKGTGKSFIYDNISRYARVIPGGKLSPAVMFFNNATKELGLIPRYDLIVIDEVQKIQADTSGELMATLKMYLESGRFSRGSVQGTAEAGFGMLGNITIGYNRQPLFEKRGIFKELPKFLQEAAFIDRIHGLAEGWYMPRITKNTPSTFLGFKGDFFSEIMHELRGDLHFSDYVSTHLEIDTSDMRDTKAISRIAEGFLKLLFPDLNLSQQEFIEYCVNPAVRMRQQIRDELSKIDKEYEWITIKSKYPDEFQITHPEEKPEGDFEPEDKLPPDREPTVGNIEIKEEEQGYSYKKLFFPYIKDAQEIKLYDPYLRAEHQIHNLIRFCEIIPANRNIHFILTTSSEDSSQMEEQKIKFDELKKSLEDNGIDFTYYFDSTLHDRWIEADTGWKIILGRGLDFYMPPAGKYTLGFINQERRRCKHTTISFIRM